MVEDGGEAEEKKLIRQEIGQKDKQPTCIKTTKEPKNETWTCAARVAVVLLTLVAVAQLIALLVWTVRWRDVRNAAMTRREQSACVNSSLLVNHEAMCPEGMYTRDGSCCGDVSYVVDVLLKKYSRTKFQDTVSARMLSERCLNKTNEVKSVAMVPGLDMPRIQQQGEGTMVFWNEALPTTILQGGFRYQDGAIFIDTTGHYYVYSQIKVTKNPALSSPDTTHVHVMSGNKPSDTHSGPIYTAATTHPFFSHHLYRHSKAIGRQLLLESSRSDCSVSSRDNTVTSSFGAVFRLEAGDTVYVETSHPQHLVDSPHSNFFGLYSV